MPATFEDVKNRLRAAFIAYKRRKMPGYHGGEALEKALDPAARICIDAKITPEDYCAALYQAYGGVHESFWPNQLTGAKAKKIAENYAANYEAIRPEQLWHSQIGLMRQTLISTQRSAEHILLDHALAFSPWFRVVATVEPDPAIIRRYGKEAKEQYTPALQEFLTKVVPPSHLERITNYERYL